VRKTRIRRREQFERGGDETWSKLRERAARKKAEFGPGCAADSG
jgi:hypothetical protein